MIKTLASFEEIEKAVQQMESVQKSELAHGQTNNKGRKMKHVRTITLLAISAALLAHANQSTAAPMCQYASSDADGDGWGWENNDSCQVQLASGPAGPQTPSAGAACIDLDGDGWGWDGTDSCPVGGGSTTANVPVVSVQGAPSNQAPAVSSLHDALKAHLIGGKWQCRYEYQAADGGAASGCIENASRPGITYSLCDTYWQEGSYLQSWHYGHHDTQHFDLEFKSGNIVTRSDYFHQYENLYVSPVRLAGPVYQDSDQVWYLSGSGYQLTIDGVDSKRLAFEVDDGGRDVMSYYLSDEHRVSCSR